MFDDYEIYGMAYPAGFAYRGNMSIYYHDDGNCCLPGTGCYCNMGFNAIKSVLKEDHYHGTHNGRKT